MQSIRITGHNYHIHSWQSFTTMAEIQQRNTNTNHENLMRSSETLASESRQSRIVKQLESFIKKISQSIFPTKLSQDQVVDSNNTLHDQSASRARESVSGTTDLQEQYKRAEKFRKAFLKTEAIFWNKIDIDIKGVLSVLDLEYLQPEFDVFLQEMKQLSRIFQDTVQKQQESSITTKSYRISESRILWEPVPFINVGL